MKKKTKNTKKKAQPISKKGRIYAQATFNNTLITVTDNQGSTICWGSTGRAGFSGARKSTPFAATTAIDRVLKEAKEKGLEEADVYIKGPGPGRNAILRTLQAVGLKINSISDVTPIPHNGVRPPKKRRV